MITDLLDIILGYEPLGDNVCCFVQEEYKDWSKDLGFAKRGTDIVTQKFYRLSNRNERTDYSSCPQNVLRAKNSERAILVCD